MIPKLTTSLITIALLSVAGASPGLAKETPTSIADGDITNAVEREIRYDKTLPFDRIDVTTKDGIVSLRGSVGSLLAKERATKQAHTVRGVRSVVNRLTVAPARDLTDDDIARRVQAALRTDPATDSYEVVAKVENGAVTLTGTVDSWRERALCATVTLGVRGVRGVENALTVARRMDRPAGEIRTEIEQALRWEVFLDHALIRVDVGGEGVVTLSGVVGSAAEKHLAMAKAMTDGVEDVVADNLVVRHWARKPALRADKFKPVPDAAIARAVERALVHDPRVYSFQVTPTVEEGLVTLKGTVDNVRAKRSAERNARNTVGVIGVLNHLKVKPAAERTDKQIATSVLAALARDPYVHDRRIEVRVADGVLHLAGDVDTHLERSWIDDIGARSNGVRDIRNRIVVAERYTPVDPFVDPWSGPLVPELKVLPEPVVHDLALERKIELELLWSPFVDSSRIDVDAKDGVVTLSGKVGSLAEMGAARQNAYQAGATLVHSELTIAPAPDAAQ